MYSIKLFNNVFDYISSIDSCIKILDAEVQVDSCVKILNIGVLIKYLLLNFYSDVYS